MSSGRGRGEPSKYLSSIACSAPISRDSSHRLVWLKPPSKLNVSKWLIGHPYLPQTELRTGQLFSPVRPATTPRNGKRRLVCGSNSAAALTDTPRLVQAHRATTEKGASL